MKIRFASVVRRRSTLGVLVWALTLLPQTGWGQEERKSMPNVTVESRAEMETALVLGPGKSLKDARMCFEREAVRGYAPAQVNLAVLYVNGWGTEKNYGAALYWLKEAAKQGQSRAYTNLGLLYLNGWGVARNDEEALKDFRYAAEHGETGAMVNVGYMTENGMGTARDQRAAVEWYRRAADRGDALGQNNLADLYLRGLGVAQNDPLAAEWFQKAAEQGNTGARIKLGFLYMTGRGVAKDPTAAYGWILAGSLAGDHRGDEYLSDLRRQINSEQAETATRHAEELRQVRQRNAAEIALVR